MISEFQNGTKHLIAGHAGLAVPHLESAYRESANDFRVRYNYAVALCMSGQRASALEVASELPKQAPLHPRAYTLLGVILEINERFEEATRNYRAAHLIAPDDSTVCALLGRDQMIRSDGRQTGYLAKSVAEGQRRPLAELTALAVAGTLEELVQWKPEPFPGRDLCSNPLSMSCFVNQQSSHKSLQKHKWQQPNSVEIEIEYAAKLILDSKSVVAITGAGISSPSGLSTRKELWQRFNRDEAVSVWRAREAPHILWTVIEDFLGAGGHQPNEAHMAMNDIPNLDGIITQNVDGLHQVAMQSTANRCPILELHGTLEKSICWKCNLPAAPCFELIKSSSQFPPTCDSCGGNLRPDVVLFGEAVKRDTLLAAKQLVKSADTILIIGCAMDVAPASELPRLAAAGGATIIEFKRNFSRLSRTLTTQLVKGCASATMPAVVNCIEELHNSKGRKLA